MTRISPQTPVYTASPATTFADGLSDRAVATWYFPTDFTNYILGVDRHWGERRSFFDNVGLNYASWHDPVDRAAHVVNGFAFGLINFLTAGTLYTDLDCLREALVMAHVPYANDVLGALTSNMKPPARTAYEAGEWTFDTVFAVVAYQTIVEYRAWSQPIRQRQKIMAEAEETWQRRIAAHAQELRQWIIELGNGDVAAAIPKLQEKVLNYPDLYQKGVDVRMHLDQGNRAMMALQMLAADHPSAMAWAQDGHSLPIIARGMGYSAQEVVAAAQFRLQIAARYAPDAAINAVVDSALERITVPEGYPNAGQVVEYGAAPQFALLRGWETHPTMRPMVMQAYQMITHTTELMPVAINATEGLVRMLPDSAPRVLECLTHTNPIVRYATVRALALRSGPDLAALPADIAAQLVVFPMRDYLVLFGRESSPLVMATAIERMAMLGNGSALSLMELFVEIGHPHAWRIVTVLRRLRQTVPAHADRITTFLQSMDTGNIGNDVILNSARDGALARDHASLLGVLAREGNQSAMDTVMRLSIHEEPLVREVVGELLVDMALDGTLPAKEIEALLQEPHPRLLPMVAYWSLKSPTTLTMHWRALCRAILDMDVFPPEVVQVLRTHAQLGDAQVGNAVSRLLSRAGDQQSALLALLQRHPELRATVRWSQVMEVAEASVKDIGLSLDIIRLMYDVGGDVAVKLRDYEPQWFLGAANAGDTRGVAGLELLGMNGNVKAVAALQQLARHTVYGRSIVSIPHLARQALDNIANAKSTNGGQKGTPTVTMQVTALDLQAGRAAALTTEVLKGRTVRSLAELNVLVEGVAKGVHGALDAMYKVAWTKGPLAVEAKEQLLRWSLDPRHPHRQTIQRMIRVLNSRGSAASEFGVVDAAPAVTARSLRHLETLVTVSRDYAPMALDELMRLALHHADTAHPILQRLLESQDPRVLDLVADKLVVAADQGKISVDFIRTILGVEKSTMGREAIITRLRYFFETSHKPSPLEVFRPRVL